MHNNFYFLRHLSAALQHRLAGHTIVSCFSQNKEELIIELNNQKESFFIKAHLLSSFCCLAFPREMSRARKNSVDLFEEVVLKKVVGVTQFENERSFSIDLEKNYSLVFKMHANRANILLAKDGIVTRIFKNQFKDDIHISLSGLNQTIDWGENYFKSNIHNLKEAYFTLGKEVWRYLEENGFYQMSHPEQWQLFNDTLQKLLHPKFYVLKRNEIIKFSLLPDPHVIAEFEDPIEAITQFFHLHVQASALQKEKGVIIKRLTSSITTSQSYIEKNEKKLEEIEDTTHYKLWADILMANMHLVKKGSHTAVLRDFLNNSISIKLKPELSVQKNAEIFYRKAKNQDIEINKIKTAIAQKKNEVEDWSNELALINNMESLTELRQHFKTGQKIIKKKKEPLPFHQVEFMGYQIWIGKNAVNNDLLTLKYAHKDDLWLHAKDVAGSHVIVKQQAGKTFPKEVIERAAELAAYNSKRKTETLCPVAYTLKKFVRKRKGELPGAVMVEREDVIMVKPAL